MDAPEETRRPPTWQDQASADNQRDLKVQSIISIVIGLFALLAFCALRPRWTSLYAARKKKTKGASILPELPNSFFGWIPTVYRISEEQVLASAGLDAYVFLAFFRLAIKFTAVTFFLQLVIMLPVHYRHTGDLGLPAPNPVGNSTTNATVSASTHDPSSEFPILILSKKKQADTSPSDAMLWLYAVFVYVFSAYTFYLIITQTKKIIRVRQSFLGGQSSITDKTIRLSGIPEDLRSEEAIKETIENLGIGKVDSVLVCRDWSELDALLEKRARILRQLENAWTAYLGPVKARQRSETIRAARQTEQTQPSNDEENSRLLGTEANGDPHTEESDKPRPKTRIWYGFMNLQTRKIDALDYYQEKLRKLDEQITTSRKKIYKPTPLAFVTMDSIASAQMANQAIMDPEPMTLLVKPAPAPSDVLWEHTYLSRYNRMFRSWSITLIIALLTVFWSLILVPIAGLLTLENIGAVSKPLENALRSHQTARALFQTALPTLVFSLLSLAVPYLYYWLSTLQGSISQGEVEMSLISKNFFFTFFNLFVVFTIFGTVSNAAGYAQHYFDRLSETLKNTTKVADILAQSLKNLVTFYMNLIVLQGLGLFPFRLLEFGSVALYPFYRVGAKTPRDYAELSKPPEFSYGFYLPQSLLIFIICIVYSTLPASWFVLFFGLIYFLIGGFIYKYQLLYAMDHSQHSTGKAWPIICKRIVLGLVVFQIAMAGILGLSLAWKRALLIIPLLVFSIWFSVFYTRTYEPLMKFIAIRSLTYDPPFRDVQPPESRYEHETEGGRTVDEDEETGLRYMNPSLVTPLEDVWLPQKLPSEEERGEGGEEGGEQNV